MKIPYQIRSTRSTDALNSSTTSRYWPIGNCNVILVGDAKVGKTNLVNRATQDKFNENYFKTSSSGERAQWNHTFSGRSVRYNIIDTNGSHIAGSISKSSSSLSLSSTSGSGWSNNYNPASYGQQSYHPDSTHSKKRAKIYNCADVFMLCFRISDPASLFSAINYWCQELRYHSPNTPIVLVGCQSDLRSDRELCAVLGKRGQAPVSVEQGISLSHQLGCVMYVETTSRFNRQSVLSAFEIAALAALGQITPKPFVHPVPPPPSLAIANPHRSINYNSVMSSTHSVNMTSGPERGAQFSVTPCLVNPPPIPPKPQIVGLPIKAKSKFELNGDGNGSCSTSDNSNERSFPPRKAISTIALNHDRGWCPKSSNDCQSITAYNPDTVPKPFASINTKSHHPSLPPKPPFDKFNKENYYNPFNTSLSNENSNFNGHPTPIASNSFYEQQKDAQYSKHSQQLHPFKKSIPSAIDITSGLSSQQERNVNSLKMKKNSEELAPLSSSASQYNLDYDHKDIKVNGRNKSRFLSGSRSHLIAQSPKLSFKTTRDRSMSSLLSIGSQRTPKIARKSSSSANTSTNSGSSNSSLPKNEKTVTIRCQRLNPNKNNTMEEVDVEVPAPIFETLKFYNGDSMPQNSMSDKQPNNLITGAQNILSKEPNERSSMLGYTTSHSGSRNILGTQGKQQSSLAAKIRSIFGR